MTFYYDESGNIRKFYLQKERKFNENNYKRNFILGGIAICGEIPNQLDIEKELRHKLKINPTAQEIKTAVIFGKKSTFLDCLRTHTLEAYLTFLLDKDFYIHYESLNLLYWSIVDIIDSIPDALLNSDIILNYYVKDVMYRFCKRNIKLISSLFYKYSYPNVLDEKVNDFVDELKKIVSNSINISKQEKYVLNYYLCKAHDKKLIFIQENDTNILIDSFLPFYENRIKLFPHDTHILDIEKHIEKEMLQYSEMGTIQYEWENSKKNIYIRISDVFVGLFGKLKLYLNNHSKEKIRRDLIDLNTQAKMNLVLLITLILKTNRKCDKWILNIDPTSEQDKINILLEYVYQIVN